MKKMLEDIKKVFESGVAFRILCAVGIVIIAVLIFSLGVRVGFHKASFGRARGEQYMHAENFGMGGRNPYPGMMGWIGMMDYFPNAHGAAGKITKVELTNITVEDKDAAEKVIALSDNTRIEQNGANIQKTDLKIGDFVVVIGAPDDKEVIEAKLIRIVSASDRAHP